MALRYRAALALTLAALFLPAVSRVPHRRHSAAHVPAASRLPHAYELYSRRALRRAKIVLELKLLELRSERLERIRKAVEMRLPVEELLEMP